MVNSTITTSIDFIYTLTLTIAIPVIVIFGLNNVFLINGSDIENINLVIMSNLILLTLIAIYYRIQYKKLYNYAIDVGYLHFKPSVKDMMLGFYGNIFSVLIVILLVLFLFGERSLTQLTLSQFLGLSLIFSTLYQTLMMISQTRAKNKLINTAMEPLQPELLAMVMQIPGSEKISEYRYADIKPASLFLTAGVTTFSGFKRICLVSRYFQWKLTQDELFSVLSHEVGHIRNKDILTNYTIITLDYILRTLYYTSLLFALSIIMSSNGYGLFEVTLIVNVALVMVASLLLRFILQYRMYNQEIESDEYGSRVVGNYTMAQTLKKLPQAIPAPVNDNPLEFLGFRVAILNDRGKKLNEPLPEVSKQFSRFSNN